VAAEAVMQVPSQLSEDPPLEPPSMNDDTRDAAACNSSPSPKDRSKTECHPECAENLELEDSSQRVESSLSVEQQADPTTAPQNQEACIQEFDNASQLLAMVPQEMPLVRSMQSSQSGGAAGSVLENALGRRDLEDALSRIESHIQVNKKKNITFSILLFLILGNVCTCTYIRRYCCAVIGSYFVTVHA